MMSKEYEYSYTICRWFDETNFQKQCAYIEKKFSAIKKEQLLEDVDGSAWQLYHHEKGDIEVVNDYQIDCVYIDSDFDLKFYLGDDWYNSCPVKSRFGKFLS